MEVSKNPGVLTTYEQEVYAYAFRDEFKGMGIAADQHQYYIDKILNASEEAIIFLRKNGAIEVARAVMKPENIFGA